MLRPAILATLAVLATLPACEREKPSLDKLTTEAHDKDEKIKRDRAEIEAKEKAERESLVKKLATRRPPIDQLFSAIWTAIPDAKTIKRKECPDAKITADTADPEKRKVLVFNQETVWRLAGKADDIPAGTVQNFHTAALDDATWMVRATGKETPLATRTPPESANEAQARLDAIDFIEAHRYLGVGILTRFKSPGGTGQGHVEGFTVIFDRETKLPLCQVEVSADNLQNKADLVPVGKQADEDLWIMFLHTTAKNFDAVSKVFTVEGVTPKKK